MRLDVIGLEPGPAQVELRYRQPGETEWLTQNFSLEFVAPRKFHELVLGGRVPHGRFELPQISSVISREADIEGPARCEAEADMINGYICFARERFGDELRYASCSTTQRCQSMKYGALQHGFWFWLKGDEGQVVRMEFILQRYGPNRIEDVWPTPQGGDDDE